MSSQHEHLIELLREINRELSKHVKEVLVNQNLPGAMIPIARQIKEQPGITVSEISRRAGIAKSHVSNVIRELEKRGWVDKKPDSDDQRLIRIFLTPQAEKHLQLVQKEIREMFRSLGSGIPEQETLELVMALEKIKAVVQAEK